MDLTGRFYSRLDLACEETAVWYAKEHAKAVFRDLGLPADPAYDALTIVAELAANAVKHAGAKSHPFNPEGGHPRVPWCALALYIANGQLCISMYDESPERPQLRPVSMDGTDGRGLQMVAGLSGGAWGYQPATPRPGKIVYAWLRLPLRRPQVRETQGTRPAGDSAPRPLSLAPLPGASRRAVSA